MKYFNTLTILLIAACLLSFRTGVFDFIGDLKKQLHTYTQNHPEEKVYIQFDKTFYKPGEDIWFNAFVLDGQTHKPSAISDVLHVTLNDPKGNAVGSLTLFIQDGTTRGDFHLDEGMAGGPYTVTACTRWMRNAGEATFFKKKLQVQSVITPRMLLKADFEKKAYGKGDEVVATLTVKDLKNEPLANARVSSTVRIDGGTLLTNQVDTDEAGKARVTFKLPDDLASPDGILQMVVSAAGQEESITRSIPIVLNKITLAFFPEGGDLTSGADNNVAFKATNEFGKGADVQGVVLDDKDNVVASFSSFHMGMGAFRFTPQPGVTYRARIDRPAGNMQPTALPVVRGESYSFMLAGRSPRAIEYTVHAPYTADVFLVGQTRGMLYYAEKLTLHRGLNTVTVPTDAFPGGIAAFTLFNGEGLEEAERLVFLHPQKTLQVAIETDKKVYAPREKVTITIRTTDEHGKAVAAKLSLAAVDDQILSFADDKQDNILSWLLLSSELKGEIQEPSFYFDPREPKAFQAIDYLLLTHGWRRFTWKDVLQNDPAVAWLPENQSVISGYILDKHQKHTQTEVTLMELGERRRIAKVKTNAHGGFTYKNVDSATPVLLLTRKPNRLIVDERASEDPANPFAPSVPGDGRSVAPMTKRKQTTPAENNATPGNLDMEEDVTALSELVVTAGYFENSRSLVSGSVTVSRNEIVSQPFISPLLALQGRMAGIYVTSSTGVPGGAANIRIRGTNSLPIHQSEPLYIIDGVPAQPGLSRNFQSESLSVENISSISVLRDADATAIYGSRGANGVILIETKAARRWYNQDSQRPGRYNSVVIQPRRFSTTREFYNAPPTPADTRGRLEDLTTVYWKNTIVTDQNGEARVTFHNSDATSAFRLTAEGITADGLVGRAEQTYATQLPFSLDTKIPSYLGFEDTLRLPILIRNNLSQPLAADYTVNLPDGLTAVTPVRAAVTVAPGQTATHYVAVTSQGIGGTFTIKVVLQSGERRDEITRDITVHPVGFRMQLSMSGRDLKKDIQFDLRDVEKGSLAGKVTVYTDLISDLFSGAEGLLAEPHGCFEQVSSPTFPNILALQFMQESGQIRPDIEQKAMQYITSGYKQLMAYEINGGGFEWFGHPPAHEALTAYGLIEFTEMKKVAVKVNEAMLERTRKWILSRRKGDGTFHQNSGKYGFASASAVVNNAYLVYALAETGTRDIDLEYTTSVTEAWSSGDMYRMALLANAAYSLSRQEDYKKMVDHFRRTIVGNGFDGMPADHSVVRSYGNSLTIETAALWTLALLKSPEKDFGLIRQSIDYILSRRMNGRFGSTQATTLALKALTQYAALVRSDRQGGTVIVSANDAYRTDTKSFTRETRERLVLDNFTGALANGTNRVSVQFTGTTEALPYALDVTWNSKTPATAAACKVRLETTLLQTTLKVNETVRLVATLRNIHPEGLPMTVALIGIPAGLSLQPWQLKELQEKGVVDFYEVLGDKLALYYRELGPLARHTINLDLKAEVGGDFTGTASCAYLYYTDEHKDWVRGNRVQIR
ncbi:MG2 domain-containing protein [Dawidia soli]|uniref:TonB-dependent receptor plug domain-containing protein n=1 Tax=Dawidia soli TaxID=2782352 RepID=A0AAP2GLB1_9BACT|nr:MG2 domain-containing protein [Dawidia soli]MBT1690425.1 TonB-dependent receptor plug domain-containing protein [Dawidia soli]